MKPNFVDDGSAHLFITWAADLEMMNNNGNDREHIDITYLITDAGWYLTVKNGTVIASKDGQKKQWPLKKLPQTRFDSFGETVFDGAPLRRDIPSVREAYEDIKLIRDAETHIGVCAPVDLSLS